ncbi:TRAP transporter large permease [Deefgea piscis]|uniref:TRAP transporter large permease n=1 Tax=Deefgea piscis TaxID=2739061 RepID=UPI001C8166E6|nr:TRAP transporter large permease [Deefgea piscis]QZA80077.1 TRAP transporter large permease [Deefgea piscis]
MDWFALSVLFGLFFVLIFLGLPVSFAIGLSSIATLVFAADIPLTSSLMTMAQKMASGLDSFGLLAIPFFILAGNIMNRGGLAIRLINFAKVLGGRLPGPLLHCNVLANMMFGALSGSAVASAAAVGGVMAPLQKKEGYDPAFSAAVNIASAPVGLLIPPSNTFIVYSLVSGGTSVAALFLAGYLPGMLWGGALMLIAGLIAKKRGYVAEQKPTLKDFVFYAKAAIPSLMLIIIIMGGILSGLCTPTEASAIAVVYCLALTFLYRDLSLKDLPSIILESALVTSIVMLLIGVSMGMSYAMVFTDIPATISDALLAISDNPIIILLIINLVFLVVGFFMDMTPAILIFTPIFYPIAVVELGMNPIHFGVMMTFNLCLGICTPPVGSSLFIGCSVAKVSIEKVIKPLLPLYGAIAVALLLVVFVPEISMFIPNLFGYE